MDNASFDRLTTSLAAGATRRRVLGALAAILGAGAAGETARAAKGGNGKGKGKDKGNGNGNGNGNAHGRNRIGVCHKGRFKKLPAPAVKGHLVHGDYLCQPSVQVGNACRTYSQTCDDVAQSCTYTIAPLGSACTASGGVPGTCDATGACTATTTTQRPTP